MKKIFLSCLCLMLSLIASAGEMSSPNGEIKVSFSLKDSVPTYKVTFRGELIVKESRLGYELAKGENLLSGFTLKAEETSAFDETWQPVWGETHNIRNHYNELLVRLSQPSTERSMNIRFRVYDDGVGFRYEFPQEGKLNYFVVKEERTEMAMTGDHTAWWIAGDYDT